jgi:CBS domain-containing protein
MTTSEFDEAYEDDPSSGERTERQLGEAILSAPIHVLEPRPAVTLSEEATIDDAIHLMLDQGIGAILVLRGGKATGIFTERDVLRRVVSAGIDRARPLREVMTADPVTLGPEDGIAFALNRMIIGGFRHVPIVSETGAPLAVLSLRDVVAFIVSLLPSQVLNLPPEPMHEARSADGG